MAEIPPTLTRITHTIYPYTNHTPYPSTDHTPYPCTDHGHTLPLRRSLTHPTLTPITHTLHTLTPITHTHCIPGHRSHTHTAYPNIDHTHTHCLPLDRSHTLYSRAEFYTVIFSLVSRLLYASLIK